MNDKIHNFDVEDAIKYGVNRAIVLYTMKNWIDYKTRNKKGLHKAGDGNSYYFAYASAAALCEKIPYISRSGINDALNYFVEKGILIKGKFNKLRWDKTSWYADASQPVRPMDIDCQNPVIDDVKTVIGVEKPDNNTISHDIPLDNKLITANAEEINSVLNTFKKNLNPYIRFNNNTERKAASELIQELGLPQVLEHIKDAERFSEDEFAPRITTPYELKTKLAKLILHKKKNSPKTVTERKLTEKQQKEMNEYGFLTTN